MLRKVFRVEKVLAPRTKEEIAALRGVDFDKRPARKVAGFRVVAFLLPGSDEMWETLEHFALFPTVERAEAFAAKCRAGRCDWEACWSWGPTVTSPLAFMHKAPTVVMETEARS